MKHPDLFTADEAAAYLRLPSDRSLETVRDKYGLRPLPLGQGLYHRADLDRVVQLATAADRDRDGSGPRLRPAGRR